MNPLQFPEILGSNQVSNTSKDPNMPDSNITSYQLLVSVFRPEETLVQQRWINEATREPEPKNFDFVPGIPFVPWEPPIQLWTGGMEYPFLPKDMMMMRHLSPFQRVVHREALSSLAQTLQVTTTGMHEFHEAWNKVIALHSRTQHDEWAWIYRFRPSKEDMRMYGGYWEEIVKKQSYAHQLPSDESAFGPAVTALLSELNALRPTSGHTVDDAQPISAGGSLARQDQRHSPTRDSGIVLNDMSYQTTPCTPYSPISGTTLPGTSQIAGASGTSDRISSIPLQHSFSNQPQYGTAANNVTITQQVRPPASGTKRDIDTYQDVVTLDESKKSTIETEHMERVNRYLLKAEALKKDPQWTKLPKEIDESPDNYPKLPGSNRYQCLHMAWKCRDKKCEHSCCQYGVTRAKLKRRFFYHRKKRLMVIQNMISEGKLDRKFRILLETPSGSMRLISSK